jgi:hypothetical protein
MKTQIAVPIQTDTFIGLVDFLREQGSDYDPVAAVERAILYWIENASWKREDLMPETVTSQSRGYTWRYKDTYLFLAQGTELRMRYKEQYHYAKVEGDEIMYQGERVSPGSLTKKIAGSSRNAWRDLWIRRPGESEWTLADQCRRDTREAEREVMRDLDQALGLSTGDKT